MKDAFDLIASPLPSGITLLEASAGTGKTYTLTGLVLRYCVEGLNGRPIPIDRIAIVTFTRAATAELKERIRERITMALRQDGEDPLRDALSVRYGEAFRERIQAAEKALDRLAINTIDAFSWQILKEHARELQSVPPEEPSPNAPAIDRAVAYGFWRRESACNDPLFAAALAFEGLTPKVLFGLSNRLREGATLKSLSETLGVAAAGEALRQAYAKLPPPKGHEIQDLIASFDFKADGERWRGFGIDPAALSEWCADSANQSLRFFGYALLGDQRLIEGLKAKSKKAFLAHPLYPLALALCEAAKAYRDAVISRFLQTARAEALALRMAERRFTFEDVERIVNEGLLSPESGPPLVVALRQRFDVALIDEFQDTSRRQWTTFERLFPKGPLVLVGDPKQSIYAFRGADSEAYVEAKARATSHDRLDRNWRSDPALIRALHELFTQTKDLFFSDEIRYEPVRPADKVRKALLGPLAGRPMALLWFDPRDSARKAAGKSVPKGDAEDEVARRTAARVWAWLHDGHSLGGRPLDPSDLAILVRSNGEVLAMAKALEALHIPSLMTTEEDLWLTEAAEELELFLELLENRRDSGRRRRFFATRIFGLLAEDLFGFGDDLEQSLRAGEDLERALDLAESTGFLAAVRWLARVRETEVVLVRSIEGERHLADLIELAQVLDTMRTVGQRSLEALRQAFREAAEGDHPAHVPHPRPRPHGRPAVRIMTIHKSKGLEFGIVICPTLWAARDARPAHPAIERLSARELILVKDREEGAIAQSLRAPAEFAEEMRLFYVALTRAKHRLEIVLGPINLAESSAIAWALFGDLAPLPDKASGPEERLAGHRAELKRRMGEWEDWTRQFALRSEGLIEFLDLGPTGSLAPPRSAPAVPSIARAAPRVQAGIRSRVLHSYSRLSGSRSPVESRETASLSDASPAPVLRDGAEDSEADRKRWPLAGFARGRRAGLALHALLEAGEVLASAEEAERRAIAERILARRGLAAKTAHEACEDPVGQALEWLSLVQSVPILPAGKTLNDLKATERCFEWRFELRPTRVSQRALGEALARSADPRMSAYGRSVAQRPPLSDGIGPFVGAIDLLVFLADDTLCVLDFKSHDLGMLDSAYSEEALFQTMEREDTLLQLSLYGLAARRFARSRGKDPKAIEARTLYLRGALVPPHHGVARFALEPAVLDALDAALQGED